MRVAFGEGSVVCAPDSLRVKGRKVGDKVVKVILELVQLLLHCGHLIRLGAQTSQ